MASTGINTITSSFTSNSNASPYSFSSARPFFGVAPLGPVTIIIRNTTKPITNASDITSQAMARTATTPTLKSSTGPIPSSISSPFQSAYGSGSTSRGKPEAVESQPCSTKNLMAVGNTISATTPTTITRLSSSPSPPAPPAPPPPFPTIKTTPSGISNQPSLPDGTRAIRSSVRPNGSVRPERRVRPGYQPPEDVERYSVRNILRIRG